MTEQENYTHNGKKRRRFVFILCAAVIIIGAFAGLAATGIIPLFSAGGTDELLKDIASSNYIEISDENGKGTGEILIRGKAEDARWEVSFEGEVNRDDSIASAENALGEMVTLDVEQAGERAVITIPKQVIEPGMPYTVTLKDDVSFIKDELKNAREITFVSERQDTKVIEYNDNVQQLNAGEASVVTEDTLRLSAGKSAGAGDILILPEGNGQNASAYYVESVSNDGLVKTREPSPDEIYRQLEISGTYRINPDDIVLDEEAIEKQVRESTLLDSIVRTVYAAEDNAGQLDVKVKLLPKKEGLLRVQIDFTLHDAYEVLGKKRDVVMTLVLGFCADVSVDVIGTLVFDVSSDVLATAQLTGGFADDKGGTLSDFTDSLYDGGEFLKDMEEQIRNAGDGVLKIGSIPFAIAPGIGITIDLAAKFSHSLTGGFDFGTDMEFGTKTGVIVSPVKFKPYSKSKYDSKLDRLIGELRYEAKAGLSSSLMFSVFHSAKVGFELEGGLYGEIAGAFKILSDDKVPPSDRIIVYGDLGLYYELSVVGEIDYIVNKLEFEKVLEDGKVSIPPMPLGSRDYVDSMAAEPGQIIVDADGKSKLPAIMLSKCDLFEGTFKAVEADIGSLSFRCPDGIQCGVDKKGNIEFSGVIPDEFTLTVGYKGTEKTAEIKCAKQNIQDVYRDYVINTLLPQYGLADEAAIHAIAIQEYSGDETSAAGIYSVYMEDMDRDGITELIVLRYSKGLDRNGLYLNIYTFVNGTVKELTANGGEFLRDYPGWPVDETQVYFVTAKDISYVLFWEGVADADCLYKYKAFGVKDGTAGRLLDLSFSDNRGNGYDASVVCNAGPDGIMSRNRKTNINGLYDKGIYAAQDDLDQWYNEGAMLMYYECYNESYEQLVIQVNDLYPDENAAIGDALSYFDVTYQQESNVHFSGLNGAVLAKLMGNEGELKDFTGWRELLLK